MSSSCAKYNKLGSEHDVTFVLHWDFSLSNALSCTPCCCAVMHTNHPPLLRKKCQAAHYFQLDFLAFPLLFFPSVLIGMLLLSLFPLCFKNTAYIFSHLWKYPNQCYIQFHVFNSFSLSDLSQLLNICCSPTALLKAVCEKITTNAFLKDACDFSKEETSYVCNLDLTALYLSIILLTF